MNLGTVMAFLLGNYFDYVAQAKFHLILSVLYVILFARIPESPQHLINVQRQKVRKGENDVFNAELIYD